MASSGGLDDHNLVFLREVVTDAVCRSSGTLLKPDYPLRARLREYERTAEAIGLDAQTVQVIRSGRRLTGDTKHDASSAGAS